MLEIRPEEHIKWLKKMEISKPHHQRAPKLLGVFLIDLWSGLFGWGVAATAWTDIESKRKGHTSCFFILYYFYSFSYEQMNIQSMIIIGLSVIVSIFFENRKSKQLPDLYRLSRRIDETGGTKDLIFVCKAPSDWKRNNFINLTGAH